MNSIASHIVCIQYQDHDYYNVTVTNLTTTLPLVTIQIFYRHHSYRLEICSTKNITRCKLYSTATE